MGRAVSLVALQLSLAEERVGIPNRNSAVEFALAVIDKKSIATTCRRVPKPLLTFKQMVSGDLSESGTNARQLVVEGSGLGRENATIQPRSKLKRTTRWH